MKLLFVDPKCPKPYHSEILATCGLGGTEASVVRVSRALSQMPHAHQVTVLQHNRSEVRQESLTLRFAPISELETAAADAFCLVKDQAREAQCLLYLHFKWRRRFGLSYAEANAVGAPELAHQFSAARKVLCAGKRSHVTRNVATALRTLTHWRAGEALVLKGDGRLDIARVSSDLSRFFTDPKYARRKLKRETT